MGQKVKVILWSLIVIILIPLIFFPISCDLSIFILAGKKIAEGGKIYVDYVDLKPPLIYYIFAGIYKIFGSSEIALRIFDFILQITTVFMLYRVVKLFTADLKIAFAACFIYSISYVSLNYNQTLQVESFVGIPFLILMYIQLMRNKKFYWYILRGVLIGYLSSLKYPLAIVFILVLLDDLFRETETFKKFVLNFLLTSVSILITILIIFIPLLDKQIYSGFFTTLDYLYHYSSIPPIGNIWIKYSLKELGSFFGDKFSLFFSICAVLGIGISLKNSNKNDNLSNLLKFSFLSFSIFFISIVVEKKFHDYHFIRLYIPMSILAGTGLVMIYHKLLLICKNKEFYSHLLLISAFCLILIFSCLPRWVNILQVPILYFSDTNKYDLMFEKKNTSSLLRVQQKQVAEIITKNKTNNAKVIVISTGSNIINYFLKDVRISKFSQSCFYFGYFAPNNWKLDIVNEVKDAEWIVVQNSDDHLFVTGHGLTSWESLKRDTIINNIITNNFFSYCTTDNFFVFKRKNI